MGNPFPIQETDLPHFSFRRTLPRYPRGYRPCGVNHSTFKWYEPNLFLKGHTNTPKNIVYSMGTEMRRYVMPIRSP